MPLELRPLRPEDAEAVMRIQFLAFQGGTLASNAVWIGGVTDALVDFYAKRIAEKLGEHGTFYFAVIDTDTNEIIGYCLWKREDDILAANRKNRDQTGEQEQPPDCNHAAHEYFHGGIDKLRSDVMGDKLPYWHLCTITTKPGHERRGAAKLGINWGLKNADNEGLVTFLDASPVGRALYERNGFEVVKKITFDFRPYGLDGSEEYCAMIRQPQSIT